MLRLMMVTMTCVLMFQPCLTGDEKVVIAVASEGETLDAAVSHLAARAPYFHIVDGNGKFIEAAENSYKDNRGGAGVSAANFLAEKNVTIVVAGNFGSKMMDALKAQKIAYVKFDGIVEDAIDKVLKKDEGP